MSRARRALNASSALPPLIAAVSSGLSGGEALAYERTMTCSREPDALFLCEPDQAPAPLCWEDRDLGYALHVAGSADVPRERNGALARGLEDAVERSFLSWSAPECAHIVMSYLGTTSVDAIGYLGQDSTENVNLIVWRERWPYELAPEAYALTSVTFNARNGVIRDADIELNGEHFTWSVGGEPRINEVDVRNTVTHEVGHFIGLNHSSVSTSTMFASAPLGETSKRSLGEDDLEAVCAIYSPREPEGGCGACATMSPSASDTSWTLLGALALVLGARHRGSMRSIL